MKFVIIKKQGLRPNIVNVHSSAYYDKTLDQVLETADTSTLAEEVRYAPAKLNITVAGRYLTEVLLKTITPAYLRGTEITINGVTFPVCEHNPQYAYVWQEQVPQALPQHLKNAYYNRRLRDELYEELVAWNQSRIELAKKRSEFKWSLAEEFYKQVYKTFTPAIKVQSPNEKTFYEATAELELERWLPNEPGLTPDEERQFADYQARHYFQAFDVQDTDFTVGLKHRTTRHGITEEPCLTSQDEINAVIAKGFFDRKNHSEREGYTRPDGFTSFQWQEPNAHNITSIKRIRENLLTVTWYLKLTRRQQEEFLKPGWHFCPICNRLYHESEGCFDRIVDNKPRFHVEPDEIEFIPYNENHD